MTRMSPPSPRRFPHAIPSSVCGTPDVGHEEGLLVVARSVTGRVQRRGFDQTTSMVTNNVYDAAVVGAGPAGARTAESLALRGLRVALIERDPAPGEPVHCTGIVSTDCFVRYELPSSLLIQSVSSFVLRSPQGRGTTIQRKATQAYILDRVALDRLLVERAVEAGVELITSMTVDGLRWTGQGVEMSATRDGVATKLWAKAAVVATGFGSKLPRDLGFGKPAGVLSGCQAIVETEGRIDRLEVFTGSAFGGGGFGWLVPWKPGLALAGIMTRRETMSYLRGHIKRLQDGGRVGSLQDLFRCRAIPLGVAARTVRDGILGVGDAVGQVKPTSGGGIYFGLLGADIAAEVLGEALKTGDVSAEKLLPYETRWRALLESEIRQGYALRLLLERLPDSMIEHLHRTLSIPGLKRVLMSRLLSFDWHSGTLTSFLDDLQIGPSQSKDAAQ